MTMTARKNPGTAAFSLVEVVLAIGLVAFAVTTLFSLLPVGLNSIQNAETTETAMDLLQYVAMDIRNTDRELGVTPLLDLAILTDSPSVQSLYFNEHGEPVGGPEIARFRLRATPCPQNNARISVWHLEVAWPPQAANPPDAIETIVQLSRHP